MTGEHIGEFLVPPSIEETSRFMEDWSEGVRIAAPSGNEMQWMNDGGERRKRSVAMRTRVILDRGDCKSHLGAACLAIRELMDEQ